MRSHPMADIWQHTSLHDSSSPGISGKGGGGGGTGGWDCVYRFLAVVDAGVEVADADADADEALESVMRPEHTRALDNASASKSMPGTGCSLSQWGQLYNMVLPLSVQNEVFNCKAMRRCSQTWIGHKNPPKSRFSRYLFFCGGSFRYMPQALIDNRRAVPGTPTPPPYVHF